MGSIMICFWSMTWSVKPMTDVASKHVGEMMGNERRPFLKSRIRILIRLCSLPIHSPGICMLRPIKLSTVIMLGECMRNAWVIN